MGRIVGFLLITAGLFAAPVRLWVATDDNSTICQSRHDWILSLPRGEVSVRRDSTLFDARSVLAALKMEYLQMAVVSDAALETLYPGWQAQTADRMGTATGYYRFGLCEGVSLLLSAKQYTALTPEAKRLLATQIKGE